jgi:flagellar biosynthetic protein FlhB
MAEDADQSQKTEEPTHKKLEEARKKGQVASSREVNHWFMILAATVCMIAFVPSMMRDIKLALLKFVQAPHAINADLDQIRLVMIELVADLGAAVMVPLAVVVVAALGGGLVQNGLVIAAQRIQPKLEKISLASGVKRLFSLRAIAEFVKGILKLALVATVATVLILPEFHSLASIPALDAAQVMGLVHDLAIQMLLAVLAVVTVIAALDFLYQKYEFIKTMRMSRHELREEFKQTEGDPMIKSRLRQIRMERARRRMMAAVPEADVVVTNPTHYAVALEYEAAEMAAPKVVAKGVDSLARRIREIAEEHDVAVVENPPLAQALYAGVEIDEEIPEEHYKAVAEIIGYVFRLKRKAIPA